MERKRREEADRAKWLEGIREKELGIRNLLLQLGQMGCREAKLKGNLARFVYNYTTMDGDTMEATVTTTFRELDALESSASSAMEEEDSDDRREGRMARKNEHAIRRDMTRHQYLSSSISSSDD